MWSRPRPQGHGQGHNPKAKAKATTLKAKADILWPQAKATTARPRPQLSRPRPRPQPPRPRPQPSKPRPRPTFCGLRPRPRPNITAIQCANNTGTEHGKQLHLLLQYIAACVLHWPQEMPSCCPQRCRVSSTASWAGLATDWPADPTTASYPPTVTANTVWLPLTERYLSKAKSLPESLSP